MSINTYICIYVCLYVVGDHMEEKEKYIKLDDILNAINIYIEARQKKANCSKGPLIELKVFELVKAIIKKMKIYEF